MVEASGHMEGNESRMVKRHGQSRRFLYNSGINRYPESDPGSCNDRNRCDNRWLNRETATQCVCEKAEEQTIDELNAIAKPYVILLNSQKPYSDETRNFYQGLERKISGLLFYL